MSVLVSLALSAVQAITQVAVICCFGHILARKGYLSQPLQKGLSILSVKFFTPCLLFANTAASVTWDNFVQLWPLPVYFILFSLTAWLLAKAAARPLGLTVSQTRFVTATLMFSNTNSLPIGLIESLTMSGAVAWLRWHEDDKSSLVAARGIAYIVFYSILGNVVRWSYGAYLLGQDLDAPREDDVMVSSAATTITTTRSSARNTAALSKHSNVTPPPSHANEGSSTIYSAQYLAKPNGPSLNRYPSIDSNQSGSNGGHISLRITTHRDNHHHHQHHHPIDRTNDVDVYNNRNEHDDYANRHHHHHSRKMPSKHMSRSMPPSFGLYREDSFARATDKLMLALSDESTSSNDNDDTESESPINSRPTSATSNYGTLSPTPNFNSEAPTPINNNSDVEVENHSTHSGSITPRSSGSLRRAHRPPPLDLTECRTPPSDFDSSYEPPHAVHSEQRSLLHPMQHRRRHSRRSRRSSYQRRHYPTDVGLTIHRAIRYIRNISKPIYHYLKPILTAPFLAALFGLIVALSPLRDLLIESDGLLHSTLFAAIRDCGEAAVPVILVCLGAQLTTLAHHDSSSSSSNTTGTSTYSALEANLPLLRASTSSSSSSTSLPLASAPAYPSYRRVIPFVIISRLVLLPTIALMIVWFTLPFAGGLREDPMFLFTVLLIGACPTAINLMTVCQANGHFERPMGKVLMWEYLLSACSMVGWCVAFLWLAKRDHTV